MAQEATPAVESRETVLRQAASAFLRIHARWTANNDQSLLTDAYEGSLKDLVRTFAEGDLPGKFRSLAVAVETLAEQWDLYEGYVTQESPMPTQAFWEAVGQVQQQFNGAGVPRRRSLEPVSLLIQQNVSPNQIALHIYGYRPEGSTVHIGPFLENGVPRHDLVHKEAKEPGSVIGSDWVHPAEEARMKEELQLQRRRLDSLAERGTRYKPAPETIEKLLTDGVYPNQIARMKLIPVEAVYAEAARLGITPTEMPDLRSLRAPQEPAINPYAAAALDARMNHEAADEFDGEESDDVDQVEPEGEDDGLPPAEDLDGEIRQYAARGASVRDIANQLGIDVQRVDAVLGGKV